MIRESCSHGKVQDTVRTFLERERVLCLTIQTVIININKLLTISCLSCTALVRYLRIIGVFLKPQGTMPKIMLHHSIYVWCKMQ